MSITFDQLKQRIYQNIAVTPSWPGPIWAPGWALSDIVLHLPVIEWFASLCDHCTEFGMRHGHSTTALIAGCKKTVVSYDIERYPTVDLLSGMQLPCEWQFRLGDTGEVEIEETDLLLIDTLHIYDHVKKELAKSGDKARKFLVFHDTHTCGLKDASGPNPNAEGILRAIVEFRRGNPQWKTAYSTTVNNGLLVLERKP